MNIAELRKASVAVKESAAKKKDPTTTGPASARRQSSKMLFFIDTLFYRGFQLYYNIHPLCTSTTLDVDKTVRYTHTHL